MITRGFHPLGTVAIAAAIVLSAATPAWAQDPIEKLGRGVVNILTGWIEIPKQVHQGAHQQEREVTGAFRGFFTGAGMALLRMGVGLYETVTFPIPYPKDFASPYEHMQANDFAWE